jgi:hypothetical protein
MSAFIMLPDFAIANHFSLSVEKPWHIVSSDLRQSQKNYASHAPLLIERQVNPVNPACEQNCWHAGL